MNNRTKDVAALAQYFVGLDDRVWIEQSGTSSSIFLSEGYAR